MPRVRGIAQAKGVSNERTGSLRWGRVIGAVATTALALASVLTLKGLANDNLVPELRREAQPATLYGGGGIQTVDVELSRMRGAQQHEGRALSRLFAREERLDATTDTQPVAGPESGEPEDGPAAGGEPDAGGTASGGGSECGDGVIEQEIERVFGDASGAACRVAACESGTSDGRLDGNWATSGSSWGVFQINQIHAQRWPDFFEGEPPNWSRPEWNVSKAFELYGEQGWQPWSCSWAAY